VLAKTVIAITHVSDIECCTQIRKPYTALIGMLWFLDAYLPNDHSGYDLGCAFMSRYPFRAIYHCRLFCHICFTIISMLIAARYGCLISVIAITPPPPLIFVTSLWQMRAYALSSAFECVRQWSLPQSPGRPLPLDYH
jgi:hypothetical protein